MIRFLVTENQENGNTANGEAGRTKDELDSSGELRQDEESSGSEHEIDEVRNNFYSTPLPLRSGVCFTETRYELVYCILTRHL